MRAKLRVRDSNLQIYITGFSVLQVMATDKDQGENGEFTYQLNDPEGAFSIDLRTGWLTVRNQVSLFKLCIP